VKPIRQFKPKAPQPTACHKTNTLRLYSLDYELKKYTYRGTMKLALGLNEDRT
jgi:hypothetical protein